MNMNMYVCMYAIYRMMLVVHDSRTEATRPGLENLFRAGNCSEVVEMDDCDASCNVKARESDIYFLYLGCLFFSFLFFSGGDFF